MSNQPTREREFAAGSMYMHGRTVVFDGVDDDGPVTVSVIVDEEVLASELADVIAGLARLTGDHAQIAEHEAAQTRRERDESGTVAVFPPHDPAFSTALVTARPALVVTPDLLRTSAERAAAQLLTLPHRPVGRWVEYREERVSHHGGEYVAPGRRAVCGTWRYSSPEVCQDDRLSGVWIGPPDRPADQVLVCVSCGLDCT